MSSAPLEALRAFGPGGILLFGRNVGPADDFRALVAELRAAATVAPLIALDQEGGRVARITDPDLVVQLPSPMALAAGGDADACRAAGLALGRDLARLGISVNFAPCADLALDPASTVIGTRSFGDRPADVAAYVTAFARGLEAGGVAATIKHFPGHGATAVDSHLALPRIAAPAGVLRVRDLVPFASAIAAGAASIVMSAHVLVPALDAANPATLSAAVLTGLLREQLGFRGVIATDCLEMAAIADAAGTAAGAVRAVTAGADLLLVSHHLERAGEAADAIVAAVERGTLPLERLAAAAARVGELRARYARPHPTDAEVAPDLAQRAAQAAVTALGDDLRLAAGKPVTVISFEGALSDGVSDVRARRPSLSAALRARRWKSELLRVPLEPERGDLDLLVAELASLGARNFVLVIRQARLHAGQRAAVKRILALAPDAIVICAGEPFDAAAIPSARRVACIYGDEASALEGCADVLSGRIAPTGRLPVSIDRALVVR